MSNTLLAARSASVPWMLTAFAFFAAPHALAQSAPPTLQQAALVRFTHVFAAETADADSRSAVPFGPMPRAGGDVEAEGEVPDGQTAALPNRGRTVRKVAPAGPYDKYIQPGQQAPRLTNTDKVVIGFRDSVTPLTALGWFGSASFEQIVNGPPNYPQTGTGYLQRIGAASARGASENVFTSALFAPIFHQDPRYYKMGPGHAAAKRILYAASRTLIARGDNGHPQLNLSLLLGHLGGTSLTQWYYPPLNRGFRDLSHTYIESLVGASVSFSFSEYLSETLNILHLQSIKFL